MSKQKQLNEALFHAEQGEFVGIVISDERNNKLREIPEGYRGLCLHINDHGNVTFYKCFKNGNRRIIADRV